MKCAEGRKYPGEHSQELEKQKHSYHYIYQVGRLTSIPLQYSCLENPMGGGAWLAAIYGVAQSRTRLKRLSSSSRLTSATDLYQAPLYTRFWATGKG